METEYSRYCVETKKSDLGAKFLVDNDPRDQDVRS